MLQFLAWLWRAVLAFLTGFGVFSLTFARDDFKLGFGNIMNFTIVDLAAVLCAAVFAHILWVSVQELPVRWNPVKKRALKGLYPIIVRQYQVGRHFTSGTIDNSCSPEFLEELGGLRADLILLGIEFPDDAPGHLGWGWWIGFLVSLMSIAEKGDLVAAQNLRRKPEVNNQPDS